MLLAFWVDLTLILTCPEKNEYRKMFAYYSKIQILWNNFHVSFKWEAIFLQYVLGLIVLNHVNYAHFLCIWVRVFETPIDTCSVKKGLWNIKK